MLDSKDIYQNKYHEIEQLKVTCSSWFILIWVTVSLSVWLTPCFSVWLINAVSLWWATPSYPEVHWHSVLVSISAGTPETFYRGGVYKNCLLPAVEGRSTFFSKVPSSVFTRTRCEFYPCFVVIISHNHYREIICMFVTCLSVYMNFKPVFQDLKRLKINCRWWNVKSAIPKRSHLHSDINKVNKTKINLGWLVCICCIVGWFICLLICLLVCRSIGWLVGLTTFYVWCKIRVGHIRRWKNRLIQRYFNELHKSRY